MIRKKYSGNLEKAFDRLCFICGDLFNNRVYAVDNYLDVLCKVLNRPANSFVIPGVIPYNFL